MAADGALASAPYSPPLPDLAGGEELGSGGYPTPSPCLPLSDLPGGEVAGGGATTIDGRAAAVPPLLYQIWPKGRRRTMVAAVEGAVAVVATGRDMDRLEWMYHWPMFLSPYMEQVSKFIDIAKEYVEKENRRGIYCPCAKCKNEKVWENLTKVNEHLVTRGFMENYVIWTHHGENDEVRLVEEEYEPVVEDMDCTDGCAEDNIDLEELLCHVEPELLVGSARGLDNFEALKKTTKDILYDESKGCHSDFSILRKEYASLVKCPTCGASRYKSNSNTCLEEDDTIGETKRKIPQLVMWYLPVKDRIKRLYSNPRDAELMRWHQEGRKKDGMLRHPADAHQWLNFDAKYKEFAKDPRNIRFALSTDGLNPFGDMSSSHSTWPVLLTMYNLPTWLGQKRKYILLCILIQGPRQPGIDIDVFLEPLLEDMADLWHEGLKVWDEYLRQHFTVKAIIFVTIYDYPAMFSVSRQIKGSNKLVYLRHRQFLPKGHKFRKMKAEFDGTEENDSAPKVTPGDKVCEATEKIECVFGKGTKKKSKGTKRKKTSKGAKQKKEDRKPPSPFKKHSIFFKYLPYWKDLEIRHAKDVMHQEKNIFDNDGLQSRSDLVEMGIREELHPQEGEKTGKVYLPPAYFTLTPDEKKAFFKSLCDVKVPIGFSSNIRRLVSMKDLSVSGYNSHDCHVLLTVFLAVAIRAIQREHLKIAITKMCYFFNAISQKVIDPEELALLRTFPHEIQCQLEMYFPPSFFNMMEHLMVHIVPQIVALGPLYLHQMWSYERYMAVLKGYVWNRAHPEGSMVEGYNTEEVVECCIDYLKDGKTIGIPVPRHEGRLTGRGTVGKKRFVDLEYKFVSEAHFSVLHQLAIVEPYIDQHLELLRSENKGRTDDWMIKEHKRRFVDWLQELNLPDGDTTEEITMKRFSCGQSSTCQWVKHLNGVIIDKFGLTVVDLGNVRHKDDSWVLADRVAQVFYVTDPANLKKEIVLSGKQKIL
uniref:Transposon protein, putative, CACTA, En/Spm sub-class n=1 Tax=Oryza sativa subsp. japonica TaxID=39947 RepID=Q339S5_ORYSJ|nr:transposon protein, putative, CACTA, En/Spm sub-class [Oryza sativa Japonica Group]